MSVPEATKLRRVDAVAEPRSEVVDEHGRERAADDAHAHHHLLHERLRGALAVQRNGCANGDSLRGAEEAGDDADRREHDVEAPHAMNEEEAKAERGAKEVRGDERELDGPAINEHTAEDAEHRDGRHVSNLHAGDLLRGGVQVERHDDDDREQREEVAEDGNNLRVPEAPEDGDAHDLTHAHGGGRRGRGE